MNDTARLPTQTYLTVREVAERYRVDTATIWAWLADGKLPRPVKFSSRCTRWDESDLRAFEARLRAEQRGGMIKRRTVPESGANGRTRAATHKGT